MIAQSWPELARKVADIVRENEVLKWEIAKMKDKNAELKQQLEKLQNKKLAEEEQALERACEWNIYDLKLHETRSADDFFITRVPGGWIYTHYVWDRKTDNPIFGSSAFVPYTTNLKGPRWE